MKHEFSNETPMLRLVFATAALSVTLSIGGFIDFLALGYASVADSQRSLQTPSGVPNQSSLLTGSSTGSSTRR